MENPLDMRGLAGVEFASHAPHELDRLFASLGFSRTHRHRTRLLDAYRQGNIRLFMNREKGSFADRFREAHGPCVSALMFAFRDPKAAFAEAIRRGARPFESEGARSFDVPAIFGIGGSVVYFVDAERGVESEFLPHDVPKLVAERAFSTIDHLTNNVERGELDRWSHFYKGIFGFTEVRSFDIEGQKSGLYSYALRSPCGSFCIPINEDKGNTGQIAEYLREYRGPGVQHIALLTKDILSSLEAIGGAVEMLDVDPDYYDEAFARAPGLREDKELIKRRRVLVDGDIDGYLLQIFTKNLIGPIFFEFIQRENHFSFGEGNFSALFRSIERDQEKRGVI